MPKVCCTPTIKKQNILRGAVWPWACSAQAMLSAAPLFVRALQIVPPQFEGIAKNEGGASDQRGPAMALNS
jgi:hypothetical protein